MLTFFPRMGISVFIFVGVLAQKYFIANFCTCFLDRFILIWAINNNSTRSKWLLTNKITLWAHSTKVYQPLRLAHCIMNSDNFSIMHAYFFQIVPSLTNSFLL